MGWMILLLVVLLLIGWIVMRSRSWQTLIVGTGGSAEEVETKYAYLKTHNVKCRLKTEASAGMGIAQAGVPSSGNPTVKLDVHKKDVARANELLQEFNRQAPF
jgi:hypothetical protein